MTESSSAPSIVSAISSLKFPFKLTKDQVEAVDAWITNGYKGSIIYSTGTGKTEIAFECAKRAAETRDDNSFNILFLVPRIVVAMRAAIPNAPFFVSSRIRKKCIDLINHYT